MMLRTARFLLSATRPAGPGEGPAPAARTTAGGVSYDLYEPAGTARRTCLLVHGVTLAGKGDVRLVAFARRLAAAGVRTAAVDLAGLKSCRFCEDDVRAIAGLAASLRSEFGAPAALTGFSFGAGLALVAAAMEPLAGCVDAVLCFGAYHSLDDLWQAHLSQARPPETDAEWHDHIYMRLALAFPVMARLGLDEGQRADVAAALGSYCTDPSIETKRRAFSHIERRTLRELHELSIDSGLNKPLSPAGRLQGLRARVELLHDANDRLIPPEHSRRLYSELGPGRARLLVTPLLSHVTPGSLPRGMTDVPALLRMVGAVVG